MLMASTTSEPIASTCNPKFHPSAPELSPSRNASPVLVIMHDAGQAESNRRHTCQQKSPAYSVANRRRTSSGLKRHASNIQVHDFERVVFDELAARFDVFAHQ